MGPWDSAVVRSRPASLSASLRCGPGGKSRARSNASAARISWSILSDARCLSLLMIPSKRDRSTETAKGSRTHDRHPINSRTGSIIPQHLLLCDTAAFSHPSPGWEPCIAKSNRAKFTLSERRLAPVRSPRNGCGGEDRRPATYRRISTAGREPAATGQGSVGQRPPLRRHPLGTALRQRKDREGRI